MRISKRKNSLLVILIFVVEFFMCFLLLKNGHAWGDDFAQYLEQARSIVLNKKEEFVEANSFIVLNSPVNMATVVYPWGYPFLLSCFYAVFNGNIFYFKIISSILISFSVCLLFIYLNRYFNKYISFVSSLCIGLNYNYICSCNKIESDILFLDLFLLVMILMDRYSSENKMSFVELTILGAAIGYSFLVRSQGIAIIISFVLCNAIRFYKRGFDYKYLYAYIPMIIVLAIDFLYFPKANRSSLYFLEYMDVKTFLYNIKYYLLVLIDFLPFNHMANVLIYCLCFILMIIGIVKAFNNYREHIFIFVSSALLICINLLFPWYQGYRYMIPLIPFMVIFTLFGIEYISNKMCINFSDSKHLITIVLILAFSFTTFKKIYLNIANKRVDSNGAYINDAVEIYDYINSNTDINDIICFFKPRLLYYETGRLTYLPIDNTLTDSCETNYIIESKEINNQISIDEICKKSNNYYELVFENNSFAIYELK